MDLLESHQPDPLAMHRSSLEPRHHAGLSPGALNPANPSASFLTRIAAQERRVLEMKEDLTKAEEELEGLKRQWAAHEQTAGLENGRRKREQLAASAAGSCRPPQKHLQRNLDALAIRSGQRVFSSSKHARALSLLSGKDTTGRPAILARDAARSIEQIPNTNTGDCNRSNSDTARNTQKHSDRDDLIQSGKQLVGDFRSGFWTFLEDLRQVTVGEEALELPDNHGKFKDASLEQRKVRILDERQTRGTKPGHSVLEQEGKRDEQLLDIEHAKLPEPPKEQTVLLTEPDDGNETWRSWERTAKQMLAEKVVSSPTERTISSFSERSTPRTSISSMDQTPRPQRLSMPIVPKENVKWPSFSSLSPVRLTQTASKLMNEWEDSFRSDSRLSSPLQDGFPPKEDKAG